MFSNFPLLTQNRKKGIFRSTHNKDQVWAGFSIYVKNDKNINFVSEWLKYCCKEELITDFPNQMGFENLEGFVEHRHDQSILSILVYKKGIKPLNINYNEYLNVNRIRKYTFRDYIRLKKKKLRGIIESFNKRKN